MVLDKLLYRQDPSGKLAVLELSWKTIQSAAGHIHLGKTF